MPSRTEEIASKAMGQMKNVKGTVEGLSGVFKHLMKEHGEVSALIHRVKMSDDPEVRRDLFPKIRKELLSHEKGELNEVYPELKNHAETRSIVAQHEREAQQLEQHIREVHEMGYDDPRWEASFGRLADLVKQHVSEEEGEFFPKAQKVLGDEKADALTSRYERAKQDVKQQVS